MTLNGLLSEKRTEIIRKWVDAVLATYPADTSNFLKKQENRFSNPVGHTVNQGIEGIYDELLKGADPEAVGPLLDGIVRVRAVQDFSASSAVSFVFLLKPIIRDELASAGGNDILYGELLQFESRIDDLALLSFDIFMKCKEKLYDIRANEMKNMTYRLIQRANKLDGAREEKEDFDSGSNDNSQTKEVTK